MSHRWFRDEFCSLGRRATFSSLLLSLPPPAFAAHAAFGTQRIEPLKVSSPTSCPSPLALRITVFTRTRYVHRLCSTGVVLRVMTAACGSCGPLLCVLNSLHCGMQILLRDSVARLYLPTLFVSSDWFHQVYSRMITNVSRTGTLWYVFQSDYHKLERAGSIECCRSAPLRCGCFPLRPK